MPRITNLLGVLALSLLLFIGLAPTASAATMTGAYVTAICPTGQSPQGLWYSGSGYQGWARWVRSGNGSVQYGMGVPTWTNVHLVLGCGGTPSNWANTYSGDMYVATTPVLYRTMDCFRLRTSAGTCGVG